MIYLGAVFEEELLRQLGSMGRRPWGMHLVGRGDRDLHPIPRIKPTQKPGILAPVTAKTILIRSMERIRTRPRMNADQETHGDADHRSP